MRAYLNTIPVDILSFPQVLDKIKLFVKSGISHQVVTINALMYNALLSDTELAESVEKAGLVVPDSVGIVAALRYLFNIRTNRVTGIDLVHELLKTGYKTFLFGAKQEIIVQTVENIKKMYPAAVITGYRNGYFTNAEEQGIIDLINSSKSDILFVGLNSPGQEKWIYRNLTKLNVPVMIGIGGSFDVIAGRLTRAPVLMQKLGLEWLYRLVQEPWRISRIKDLPKFVLHILLNSRRYRNKIR
jgi:N-acetylglucosaminyldiphosphoundecaprenol N-acetyl-beta-D-mannosaminyltransferase